MTEAKKSVMPADYGSSAKVLQGIDDMETLINLVISGNHSVDEQIVSFPTPFGLMTVNLRRFEDYADTPLVKKLAVRQAKNTPVAKVITDTLGDYKEVYRRLIDAAKLAAAEDVTAFDSLKHYVFEGDSSETQESTLRVHWKVWGTVHFSISG